MERPFTIAVTQRKGGKGYRKRMDARERLAKHLARHPDDVHLPARELAALVGVGKSTAADVLKAVRDE